MQVDDHKQNTFMQETPLQANTNTLFRCPSRESKAIPIRKPTPARISEPSAVVPEPVKSQTFAPASVMAKAFVPAARSETAAILEVEGPVVEEEPSVNTSSISAWSDDVENE